MSDIKTFYNNIPMITKWWLTATTVTSVLARFGLINPYYLVLFYKPIVCNNQFWRLITAIFYFPIGPSTGIHFLIDLVFIYYFSGMLETGAFPRGPGEYFFGLIFMWVFCVASCLILDIHFLVDPLVMSILSVWCQVNKNFIVNFMFGAQFPAVYFPWVLLTVNLITTGSAWPEAVGIFSGHLYYYFQYVERNSNRPPLIGTPAFLHRFFGNNQQNPVHPWGGGQVLGFQ